MSVLWSARGVMAGLFLLVMVSAAPGQPIRERIDTLITQARQAETIERGIELVDQAERIRSQSGAGLSGLERLRFEADLLRVRGALVSRLGARGMQRSQGAQRVDDAQRAMAIRDLNRAIRLYREVRTDAETGARTIEDRAVKAGSDYTGSRHWQSLVGEATRTIYTTAWCHYAMAMLAQTRGERDEQLREAIDGFEHFTNDGYRNNPVVIDAFLGQALCLYEQGKPFAIRELLKGITASNAPRAAYQRLTLVQMQAFAATPSHLEVERVARVYFDGKPVSEALDPVELSMLLIRAESLASLASERSNPVAYRSFQPALEAVAGRLMDQGEPWASRVSGLVADAGGQVRTTALHRIREDFEAERFEKVYMTASAALADLELDSKSVASPVLIRNLRWYVAASAWRLERWGEAFTAAATFAREYVGDEKAGEMAGLAFDAAQRATGAMDDDEEVAERIDAEAFESWATFATAHFDNLPQLARLPLYRAGFLLAEGRFAEGYALLAKVEPSSPIYEESLVNRALAAWRVYGQEVDSANSADVAKSIEWLSRAHEALDRFMRERRTDVAERVDLDGRGAHLALLVVRAWLSFDSPESVRALALLGGMSRLTDVSQERRAWRMALEAEAILLSGKEAKLRVVMDERLRGVEEGVDDLEEARVNRLALSILADRLEARSATAAERALSQSEARELEVLIEVYAFLIRSETDETVELRRRYARSLYRLGEYDRAIAEHRHLLESLEERESAGVLREMALSYEGLNRWDTALERWRSLAQGLEEGSEAWFEAKYHVIRCHDELGDRAHAIKLTRYMRLRHSVIEYDHWERAFAELLTRWGGETP